MVPCRQDAHLFFPLMVFGVPASRRVLFVAPRTHRAFVSVTRVRSLTRR